MPRLSPARAEARRRQILEAALTCFARSGFQKASMQDIVEEAGLSPGALYCHFASKDEIILALVKERHRREEERLSAALETESFAAGVERLAAEFIGGLAAPEERAWRRLAVQLWAESLNDRRLAKLARDGVEVPRAMLAEFLERAQAQGKLPRNFDADATARVMIAFFQGLALQQAWDPSIGIAPCVDALRTMLRLPTRHP